MKWLRQQELGPIRALTYLAAFGLAAYAAWRLVPDNPVGVLLWFAVAIVGHDLVMLPLYGLADHGALSALRRRGIGHWIGHVRVPALMSGVLLLVFLPQVLDSATFASRWLLVSLAAFAVSGLCLLARLGYQRIWTRC